MMIRNCVTGKGIYRCRRIQRTYVPVTSATRGGRHLAKFKGSQTSIRCSVSSTAPTIRSGPIGFREVFRQIREAPMQYLTIPAVAAFLGLYTNWMGVKMLFYPIEYTGTEWYRTPYTPYGVIGWQGVVPCKTEKMASRLVDIVTKKLLSVEEAFGRLDEKKLASLLQPAIEKELANEPYGEFLVRILGPVLPLLLPWIVGNLQREIEDLLDLRTVVMDAFVRDKVVLVDLFQKVGRVELDFLVESGLGFGFILGLGQMLLWALKPKPWTLPVAGAIVGYATNWVAIKLLFDPAEPVQVGPIVVQGLFESRQNEVSDEFGNFMEKRVLNSSNLLEALAKDAENGELYSFLRRQLPHPVPGFILSAAVRAIASAAKSPNEHPELHNYVTTMLDIEETLACRLKLLSPTEFEDLLHPVFQEDEIILIAAGGVLGLIAGLGQTRLGWGGPGANLRALVTLTLVTVSSASYFLFKEVIEKPVEVVVKEEEILVRHATIRRRNTVLKVKPEELPLPSWLQMPPYR